MLTYLIYAPLKNSGDVKGDLESFTFRWTFSKVFQRGGELSEILENIWRAASYFVQIICYSLFTVQTIYIH